VDYSAALFLVRAVSIYLLRFRSTVSNLSIAQPARYITTARSPLCCETMSLRGRGAWLCFRLAKSRPPDPSAGRDTTICRLISKLRATSPRWHRFSWSRRCFPRFPLCVVTSPGPSDRIRRVGALYCLSGSVSPRLVGANRLPDAVKALHGRTPGPRSWPSTDPSHAGHR
jgi:hypothetical protein